MKNSNSTSKLIHHRKHSSRVQETKPDYAFARAGIIGAGEYRARISDLCKSTTKNGSPSVDFCYELSPTKSSRQKSSQDELKLIKERFAYDGDRLENRLDEIETFSKGNLPDPLDLTSLVGTEFMLRVSFSDASDYGQIECINVFKLPPGILTADNVKTLVFDDDDEDVEDYDDEDD